MTTQEDPDPRRTPDSVEQMDDAAMPNPISDDAGGLGEAGDAMIPEGEPADEDKDDAAGPAPHTTQMPR
jgi:hypothetical protein